MKVKPEDWTHQLEQDTNAVILDVRTEEEGNDWIIPNAVKIDIYKGLGFIYKIVELDKSKNYYVYCKSGGRSEQACNLMKQMGFENTYNLVGGMMQWKGEIIFPE